MSQTPRALPEASGSPSGSGDEAAAVTRRAGLVSLGTLSSRLLGAARDAVIAALFAVSATDAFWLAFTIPNALRVLLGEGAISGAFVPVLTEARSREGLARARQVFARTFGAPETVPAGSPDSKADRAS